MGTQEGKGEKYRVSESEWVNRNEQLRENKLKDTPWKPLCLDIGDVWRVRNLGFTMVLLRGDEA